MGNKLMYHVTVGISEKEYDAFAIASSQTNLLHSSKWAQVKSNWQNERLGFYKDDQLVGFVLKTLKNFGRKKRAVFAKFDPAILLRQYHLKEEIDESRQAIDNLKSAGAQWIGPTKAISETIQPRFQANIYTKANIEENFPKHTKRLIKDAKHRGVQIYRANIDDLPKFATVVALTENRKGVALRNENYFHQLMTIYGEDAYLYLAKVNLPKRLAQFKEQLLQIQKDLSETPSHQKSRLTRLNQQEASVKQYILEFQEFSKKYPDEPVIAGILSIRFGNVLEMLYAGMDDSFRKFYPQYLLNARVFKDAFKNGIVSANLGGVEGSLNDGLTKFKSNFNPMFEEYIGEFNLAINPLLYKLANLAYTIRKKQRHSQ
ncbi:UDP-N-acetylmuramoylpentapeptide-lysine N(6)-alanyltransferase [Streptococcus agalactiae]|nr:UDP-N-acetylmuramoylpentapeptide-lysine N(6)-alanyltransferase MurM [Streptococcus agalactiae]ANI26969.1 UDP-N-acetylmuramoylpentapeptide-lysine N(6)-alanyltransferase [Streptococcus agalactiae]APO41404.1 UDP-N-acetylmuramoylpentapeptide-lysine N(6)-alanyltransferase [Streptococcus agalactiae]